jgi:hypothetical protein
MVNPKRLTGFALKPGSTYKKAPSNDEAFYNSNNFLGRFDSYVFSIFRAFHFKLNDTIGFSEQSMIGAATNVFTRVESSASLTHDNIACHGMLATV